MRTSFLRTLLLCAALIFLFGCDKDDDSTPASPDPIINDFYYPLSSGSYWNYDGESFFIIREDGISDTSRYTRVDSVAVIGMETLNDTLSAVHFVDYWTESGENSVSSGEAHHWYLKNERGLFTVAYKYVINESAVSSGGNGNGNGGGGGNGGGNGNGDVSSQHLFTNCLPGFFIRNHGNGQGSTLRFESNPPAVYSNTHKVGRFWKYYQKDNPYFVLRRLYNTFLNSDSEECYAFVSFCDTNNDDDFEYSVGDLQNDNGIYQRLIYNVDHNVLNNLDEENVIYDEYYIEYTLKDFFVAE